MGEGELRGQLRPVAEHDWEHLTGCAPVTLQGGCLERRGQSEFAGDGLTAEVERLHRRSFALAKYRLNRAIP